MTVTNPTVVVEVLSPSTEDYDRGEKREHYQQIPSVREIVLIAHDARRIEVYRRGKHEWTHLVAEAGESVELLSIECTLDVRRALRRRPRLTGPLR